MNPRVADVKPENDYKVRLWFKNGEQGIFDVKPYLKYPMYEQLKNIAFFNTVRSTHGTIEWANEADFCPDTLYLDSVKF